MQILNNKQSIKSDVQEVSQTLNSAQMTTTSKYDHKPYVWIIYSRASDHMCRAISLCAGIQPLVYKQHTIIVPDGRKLIIKQHM